MLAGLFIVLLAAGADTSAAPPPVTAPASVGASHVCSEDSYPVSALQTATEGRTVMRFIITPQGGVADIAVQESSGNTDLDNASLACARTWQYRPGMQNGVAVAVPWRAQVLWKISVGETSPLAGAAKACLKADAVGWEEMKAAPMRPVVRVHVANGVLTDVAVAGSTGDADLDSRTLACYRNASPGATARIPDGEKLLVIMKPGE